MSFLEILGVGFIGLGVLTMFVGALGVVRFPDFYTRLHAAGKGDTLGQGLVLFGLLLISGFGFDAFKLAVIIFFVMILNATSTHGLARAGWLAGMRPWLGRGSDDGKQREGQMSLADRLAVIAPVQAVVVAKMERVAEGVAGVAVDAASAGDATPDESAALDAQDTSADDVDEPALSDAEEITLEPEDDEPQEGGTV
jgi:multicomponent Na+:H+ antiporter subunit G